MLQAPLCPAHEQKPLLTPGYLYFGIDESGNFPPHPKIKDDRYKRLIFSVSASSSPSDIMIEPVKKSGGRGHIKKQRGKLSKIRIRSDDAAYGGIGWSELNGVHSNFYDIKSNNYLARQATIAYLLTALGFRSYDGQYAYIDRFWGRADEAMNEYFERAFEYFGVRVNSDSIRNARFGDTRVPIVNYADRDAYLLWNSPANYSKYCHLKIDMPARLLMDCIKFMKDNGKAR